MKRIGKAIFLPPNWFRWVFGAVSLTAILCVFRFQLFDTPAAYAAYLASSLGLYYLITVTIVPLVRRVRSWMMRQPLLRRYFEDAGFHARVSLYSGLAINLLYALFKLVTGLYYRSEWLIAIAIYYSILSLLKYTLVRQDYRALRQGNAPDMPTQWKSYRRVGWLMLLMNAGLSCITLQVIARNERYFYPGMIIFVMAAYTFYRIILAVTRVAKEEKSSDPIFSAAKKVDLIFAVTAMFTLQTAMFASFAPQMDVRVPNILTGTGVACIITGVAIYMILRSSAALKASKE